MSTAIEKLELLITSSAKGAISGIKDTESATTSLGGATNKLSGIMQKLGVDAGGLSAGLKAGLAGGALAAGAALGKLALDGAAAFADATGQVRGLQRVMGGTAEDASRVAAAMRAVGIDTDTGSKAFAQLAKRIGEGKDTLAQWGVQVAHDKSGNVDMAATLQNVAAEYQKLHDPAQRAAFLFEEFGRTGQSIAPLLSKSREELKSFYDEAAKSHQIFSADDLERGRQYQVAMRQLTEAMHGFEIELGQAVVPILTEATKTITDLSHAVDELGNIAGKKASSQLTSLGTKIGLGLATGGGGGIADSVVNLGKGILGLGDSSDKAAPKAKKAAEAVKDVGAASFTTAQSAQDLADQNTLLTGTYDDQIRVLDKTQDALLALYNTSFAAIHANEGLEDATKAYNDALKAAADAGGQDAEKNQELNRALVALEESALRAAAAAGAKAEADHQAEGAAEAHKAGVDAQIASLQFFENTLAPDSPLRTFLDGYIAKLQSVPATKSTQVLLEMGDAFGNLNSLIGLLETATNGGDPWEVFITTQFGTTPPPGRALGGPVTAGQLYRVNEIGTEFFRPAVGGDIIPLGAGGGGGVATKVDNRVTNYNITTVEPVETAVAVSQRLRADAWLYST